MPREDTPIRLYLGNLNRTGKLQKGSGIVKIIISPAKKMNIDTDSFDIKGLPQFIDRAGHIKDKLLTMSEIELKKLWKCNDSIAAENIHRLKTLDIHKNLTPALLSYEGIQYKYMAPSIFEDGQFDYISQHLRILSGFYGVLKPFDGVVPYRLEMQASLKIDDYKNLYQYWGSALAENITAESSTILNLASKEYSQTVSKYIDSKTRFVDCSFGEMVAGKLIEKGTICKMLRGSMVRWMAEANITNIDDIKGFSRDGFSYSKDLSKENHIVFLKKIPE